MLTMEQKQYVCSLLDGLEDSLMEYALEQSEISDLVEPDVADALHNELLHEIADQIKHRRLW